MLLNYFNFLFRQRILLVVIMLLSYSVLSQDVGDKKLLVKTTEYNIDFNLDFKNKKLHATATLTLKNISNKEVRSIPLLLYRLLKVNAIKNKSGASLKYSQQVLAFEDWETYQVNYIDLTLNKSIKPKESKKITVSYAGHLLGYTETGMSYVKDYIDPNFTILRPDCNAYPTVGYPSFLVNDAAGFEEFNYKVSVTVPDTLVVANGGKLVDITKKEKTHTYTYQNTKSTSRIDVAIAKYKKIVDEKLTIFHFPKDSIKAKKVLEEAKKTINLYTKWWGELKDSESFSILEIPKGWGSQADVTSIIQSAEGFRMKTHTKLYHEISHLWNVKSNDKYPPRINEGLAMFAQYLTANKLAGNTTILEKRTTSYLNRIKKGDQYEKTPMIDYGKEQVTRNSYISGMLFFQVLYELIGEENFHEMIGFFYKKYSKKGATTNEFLEIVKEFSKIDLNSFFNDWVYTTHYVKYIKKGYSINDFIKKYK